MATKTKTKKKNVATYYIDPLGDDVISINEVTKICPGNPHYESVRRWYTHGVRGHKLAVFRVGNLVYTSKDAVRDFLNKSGK